MRRLRFSLSIRVAAVALLASAGAASAQCIGSWVSSPISASGLGGGGGTRVLALTTWDPDGSGPAGPALVAGGRFSQSGTSTQTNIARFDEAANGGAGAWVQLGAGLDGEVNVLLVRNNGDLIAGGFFQNSGATPTPYIARFDGTNWQSIGGGMNTAVWALAERPGTSAGTGAGQLFAGGWFQLAGGGFTNRLARWTGSSWTTTGGGTQVGMNDWVWDLKTMPNGDLAASGAFNTINGTTIPKIARWNGTAWSPIGNSDVNSQINEIYELWPLPNGDLVASGNMARIGGVAVRNVAYFSQATQTWSAMGNGFAGSSRGFFQLPGSPSLGGGGQLYAINADNTTDGAGGPRVCRWNGTAWETVFATNGTIFSSAVLPTGDVVIGGQFNAADGAPGLNNLIVWRNGSATGTAPGFVVPPTGGAACGDRRFETTFTPTGTAINTLTYRTELETSPGIWQAFTSFSAVNQAGTRVAQSTQINQPAGRVTITFFFSGNSGPVNVRTTVSTACSSTTSSPYQIRYCPADIDCSSSLTLDDIFGYLQLWFAQSFQADFNSNGVVDLDDLFLFMAAWFAGC